MDQGHAILGERLYICVKRKGVIWIRYDGETPSRTRKIQEKQTGQVKGHRATLHRA